MKKFCYVILTTIFLASIVAIQAGRTTKPTTTETKKAPSTSRGTASAKTSPEKTIAKTTPAATITKAPRATTSPRAKAPEKSTTQTSRAAPAAPAVITPTEPPASTPVQLTLKVGETQNITIPSNGTITEISGAGADFVSSSGNSITGKTETGVTPYKITINYSYQKPIVSGVRARSRTTASSTTTETGSLDYEIIVKPATQTAPTTPTIPEQPTAPTIPDPITKNITVTIGTPVPDTETLEGAWNFVSNSDELKVKAELKDKKITFTGLRPTEANKSVIITYENSTTQQQAIFNVTVKILAPITKAIAVTIGTPVDETLKEGTWTFASNSDELKVKAELKDKKITFTGLRPTANTPVKIIYENDATKQQAIFNVTVNAPAPITKAIAVTIGTPVPDTSALTAGTWTFVSNSDNTRVTVPTTPITDKKITFTGLRPTDTNKPVIIYQNSSTQQQAIFNVTINAPAPVTISQDLYARRQAQIDFKNKIVAGGTWTVTSNPYGNKLTAIFENNTTLKLEYTESIYFPETNTVVLTNDQTKQIVNVIVKLKGTLWLPTTNPNQNIPIS